MPYDYTVDEDRNFLWVRYSGVVTVAERHAAAEHILGEVTGPARDRVLLDYRRANSLAIDEATSTALADYLANVLDGASVRIAWLVNYDHQLDPVVESKSRERGIANERFHDFERAVAWLTTPDPGARKMPKPDARMPDAPKPDPAPFAMETALGASNPNRRAHGTFAVKVVPQSPDNPPAQGAALARLSLDKQYNGPLEATGQGEMLADGGGDRKDGAYVALERVTGTLHGRAGSFALVHRALMRNGTPEEWSVVVVPGSGTDALAGLEGSLRITIEHGTHFYDLEYTLLA
ncbi:MAG TPA: DUF3224 domain-containing protein [Luteimonas sp.]|jgi:hypothetical protein|nr:DUF3224 domain-containing protein [Luteimonas sp.]